MDMNDKKEIVETSFQRKGSIRRVLPSSPQGDSLLNVSARMVSNSKPSFPKENYSQFFLEYNLISEFNMVSRFRDKYSGVYVIPSAESSLVWFGIIFVRSGIYEGGAFRFQIFFTDQFPNGGAPTIVFETSLFHPAIDEVTREFAVQSFFPEWRKDVNHVYQILVILKQILHCVDARSFEPVNAKADELFRSDKATFQSRVKQDVATCKELLYNLTNNSSSSSPNSYTNDPHYIKFSQFDEEIHGNVLSLKDPKPESISISWVQPGSLEPFSKAHY
uniref:AKT-interacting protein n=1 Tax=Cacopsylla melanoneura TaxID=428564 RepID=A0A8D8Y9E0_9HEMI